MRAPHAGRLRQPEDLLPRPARSGAPLRGGGHPPPAHGRPRRREGLGAAQPRRAGTHRRANLARSAVRRGHQEPRGPAQRLRRRSAPRHLRQRRRPSARPFRRMARGVRPRAADPRGRRPQRRGGHRGLAGKFDALGPRADRAIHSAGAYAGYLHRHLPRRHALRPLGSLLRRPARPLPDGGDHRQRRHLFDVGHRRVRPAGPAERHRREQGVFPRPRTGTYHAGGVRGGCAADVSRRRRNR